MRRLALAGAVGLLLLSSTSVFAATNNQVWRATLSGPVQTTATDTVTVHGGATLALVGNGTRASVAVKLYDVMPKWTVAVSVAGTTVPIAKGTFTNAGPAVHRFWLSSQQVAALRTALAGTSPALTISVQVMVPQPGAAPLSTPLNGSFVKVTGSSMPAPNSSVPAPKTNNQVWRGTVPNTSLGTTPATTVYGGATVAMVGNGTRASVAVKLHGMQPTWTVTVSLNGGSALISKSHGAGPAVHRFWLTGDQITALKTALAAPSPTLTVSIIVTVPASGGAAAITSSPIVVTLTKVTH